MTPPLPWGIVWSSSDLVQFHQLCIVCKHRHTGCCISLRYTENRFNTDSDPSQNLNPFTCITSQHCCLPLVAEVRPHLFQHSTHYSRLLLNFEHNFLVRCWSLWWSTMSKVFLQSRKEQSIYLSRLIIVIVLYNWNRCVRKDFPWWIHAAI